MTNNQYTKKQTKFNIKIRVLVHKTNEPAGRGIGPILETRDSTLLDQSNSAEIRKRFQALIDSDKAEINPTSHWFWGWVDHLSFPVVEYTTVLHTRVPRESSALVLWNDIKADMDRYPVLNDKDYSEREFAATLWGIEDACYMYDDREVNLPNDHAQKLFDYFWDNDQSAVESCDDTGGYPDDDQLTRAFTALGWMVEESE